MLTLLESSEQGPLLQFTFTTDGLNDREWQHTAPGEPLVSVFNDVLLPLARARGSALGSEEVVRGVLERAAAAQVLPPAIDWLGLALYAAKKYQEAVVHLLNGGTAALRDDCAAQAALVAVLEKIYGRLAHAIDTTMTPGQEHAA